MSTHPMPSPSDPPEGGTSDRPANSLKGPRPATLSASAVLPGRKRVFFHFEIGIRKTTTLSGCADLQAHPSVAPAKLGPQRPPPPPTVNSGAAALLAAQPLAGAGSGSAPSLADTGTGPSTSSSAGYFDVSVGISTETPPYTGGGAVG
jgi:hypothetical protein